MDNTGIVSLTPSEAEQRQQLARIPYLQPVVVKADLDIRQHGIPVKLFARNGGYERNMENLS